MYRSRLALLAAVGALAIVIGTQGGCSNSEEPAPTKATADCLHGGEHKWKVAASQEFRCEVCGTYKDQSPK